MPNVGTASIDLEVDRQKLGRSITDAVDKVKKPVSDKMTSLGKTMSLAVTAPVIAGFGLAVKAASDLSESVNKTDVVFGKSAKAIHDFSKNAAKDLGQSKRQAEEAAGTFGNLFVSMKIGQQPAADMSVALVKLASDLASFNNASPQEALDALRAGLVGETEPLRRFGINLNDAALREKALSLGLTKTTKEVLPPAIRAQAAYALIMEQSTTAQGDFARTSDGMANKTRIAKAQLEDTAATIGTKVLPIALKLVSVGSGILQFFTSLPADVQNIAIAGIAMVAAVGPIAGLAGNAAKAVHGLKAAFDALTIGAHAAQLSLAGGLGLALLGLGALAVGVSAAKRTLGDLNATINEGSAPAVNKFALAQRLAADESKNMQIEAYKAAVGMKGLREATGFSTNLAPEIKAANKLLGELSESSNVSAERIVQLANSMRINLGNATDEQKDKLAGAIAEISRGVTPTERLAAVTETLGNKAATTAEQFDAFKEAIDAALGVQLTAEEAAIRYAEKVDALGRAVVENGTKTGVATEQQRNLSSALIDVVSQARTETEALARAGKIGADAASQKQTLIDKLDALRQKFPQLRGPIDEYIRLVRLADSQDITTSVTTPGLSEAITEFQSLQRSIAGLPRDVQVRAQAAHAAGLRAKGGPVEAGEQYIVGEEGPELFVSKNAGYIIPNDELNSAKRNMRSYGWDLTAGLVEGVKGKTGDVSAAMRFMVDRGVTAPIERILGIASPSDVFYGYGQDTIEGYILGIQSKEAAARQAMQAFGDAMSSSFQSAGMIQAEDGSWVNPSFYNGSSTPSGPIMEDDPRWDPTTMGNRQWGYGATRTTAEGTWTWSAGERPEDARWVLEGSTPTWMVLEDANDNRSTWNGSTWTETRRMHSGGIVQGRPGEEVLAMLQAGEKVTAASAVEGAAPTQGDVYLDGTLVGRWMEDRRVARTG